MRMKSRKHKEPADKVVNDIFAAGSAGLDYIAETYRFYDRYAQAVFSPAAIVDTIMELADELSVELLEWSAA